MAIGAKGVPQPTGTIETLEADRVILALGQQAGTGFLRAVPGIAFKDDGTVIVGPRMMTGYPGIFAGGDRMPSVRTVTTATGHGKKAARHIDSWLREQSAAAHAAYCTNEVCVIFPITPSPHRPFSGKARWQLLIWSRGSGVG